MNEVVSYELGKLLKEKGFKDTIKSYTESGKLVNVSLFIKKINSDITYYPAPTIAEVVMWLHDKYEVWVAVVPEGILSTTWAFTLFNLNPKKGRIIFNSPRFESPTEAFEAGIMYAIENLL